MQGSFPHLIAIIFMLFLLNKNDLIIKIPPTNWMNVLFDHLPNHKWNTFQCSITSFFVKQVLSYIILLCSSFSIYFVHTVAVKQTSYTVISHKSPAIVSTLNHLRGLFAYQAYSIMTIYIYPHKMFLKGQFTSWSYQNCKISL